MTQTSADRDDAADRTVIITRDYDVPAKYLFLAYSTREHIMKWFGPVGWPVTMCEMDFRVGGSFRMQMTGPGGETNTPFGGTYLEIVPNQRIVFDNGFEGGTDRMVMTVSFEETNGKTRLTLNTLFGSAEMYAMHVGGGFTEGTNSGFDQLGAVAAQLQADQA